MKNKPNRSYRFITISMIAIILTSSLVYASGVSQKVKGWENSLSVWQESSSFTPNKRTRINIEESSGGYVPANFLYGDTLRLKQYRGEVSLESTDYFSNEKDIMGISRTFKGEDKNHGDTEDLRVAALMDSPNQLTSFIFGLSNAIRSIPIFFFNLSVDIKELKFQDILNVFSESDTGETIFESLKTVFLKGEDGVLSPFFVIFIILWIFGMIGVSIRYIRGNEGFSVISREIGFLLISLIVFSIAVSNGSMVKVSKASIKIAEVINESIYNVDNIYEIFDSDIGEEHKDIINKQKGLFVKSNIENSIVNLFDVESIRDLDIVNFTIPSPYINSIAVSNGGESIENIGYMYWAGSSSISNINEPILNGEVSLVKNSTHNSSHWLIPDILEASGGLDNPEINTYFRSLSNPSGTSYFLSSLIFIMTSIAFIIAIGFMLLLIIQGKIFISISGIALLFLPALILWKKTRMEAMNIARMYIGSILRFTIGSLLFSIYLILFNMIMSKSDHITQIIALIIFSLLAYLSPRKIIPAINNALRSVEGNGALARAVQRGNMRAMRPFTTGAMSGAAFTSAISKMKGKLNKDNMYRDEMDEEDIIDEKEFKHNTENKSEYKSDDNTEDQTEDKDYTNRDSDKISDKISDKNQGDQASPEENTFITKREKKSEESIIDQRDRSYNKINSESDIIEETITDSEDNNKNKEDIETENNKMKSRVTPRILKEEINTNTDDEDSEEIDNIKDIKEDQENISIVDEDDIDYPVSIKRPNRNNMDEKAPKEEVTEDNRSTEYKLYKEKDINHSEENFEDKITEPKVIKIPYNIKTKNDTDKIKKSGDKNIKDKESMTPSNEIKEVINEDIVGDVDKIKKGDNIVASDKGKKADIKVNKNVERSDVESIGKDSIIADKINDKEYKQDISNKVTDQSNIEIKDRNSKQINILSEEKDIITKTNKTTIRSGREKDMMFNNNINDIGNIESAIDYRKEVSLKYKEILKNKKSDINEDISDLFDNYIDEE